MGLAAGKEQEGVGGEKSARTVILGFPLRKRSITLLPLAVLKTYDFEAKEKFVAQVVGTKS